MEKKKRIVIIASIVVTLLFIIGASYAYFTTSINKENEENKKVEVTTSALARATMEMGSKITAEGVLPGYKTVKTVRVYGRGPDNAKPTQATITLTPNVTDFSNHIEYEIYALDTTNKIDANNICSESNKQSNNNQYYDEMTCDTTNLGEKITNGVFNEEEPVGIEIEVTSKTDKTYYILVKYVNDEENPQDNEQGKKFTIDIDFGTEIQKGPNAADYITELAKTSSEIVDDETSDHNLRYIGKNPNNYVSFNNELWRIIGVMKDVADEAGVIEPRIKLIRSMSLGNFSWDNKSNGVGSSISEYGSNDWSDSQLMMMLNSEKRVPADFKVDENKYVIDINGYKIMKVPGSYWNKILGYKPDAATTSSLTESTIDFSSIGLSNEAKSMISSAVWKLGGAEYYSSNNTGLATHFYGYERGTRVNIKHATEWTGEIGLMYPSDYGYATSGGATTDRSTCLNTALVDWSLNKSEVSDCPNNDWLSDSSGSQWTITPRFGVYNSFEITSSGMILSQNGVTRSARIRPVIYISNDIKIISGTGTSTDPYILKA